MALTTTEPFASWLVIEQLNSFTIGINSKPWLLMTNKTLGILEFFRKLWKSAPGQRYRIFITIILPHLMKINSLNQWRASKWALPLKGSQVCSLNPLPLLLVVIESFHNDMMIFCRIQQLSYHICHPGRSQGNHLCLHPSVINHPLQNHLTNSLPQSPLIQTNLVYSGCIQPIQ